ncbi:ATP-grasp domain-containing protein [Bacillus sp. B15-48]|uniref:ATP-grasp domain-containing protein n=1 Tax=Bacillus sp. B15-48 TaxID=1548601 RepID=UPI00193FC246|nr:ATP-grasp domain-containing protein [Bacillus sp. B15-48]MBM4761463.1 ATP-grasp domain-containing protein [Bacillus sp. B15-48]
MERKILILGIGHSQVDLINIAKEMHMKVYACARDNKGPGFKLVDDFRRIDIQDVEAVKKYALEKEVDFIYSMALESAIPTITKVSESLNLPNFCSVSSLMKLENKGRWRQTLGEMEGNVKFAIGRNINDFENWDKYPSALKPVDGSGQRGVYKVNSYQDIINVFNESIKHSKVKELIIEEYINGPEISVNSFMYNGELKFSIVSDRISYSEYPGGIIKEHIIPSRIINKKIENRINSLVEKVNGKMGFENGHIYFQIKLEDNEPKLIEFTPRFDGCHMWRLIYKSTELDLRKVSLEILAYGKSDTIEDYDTNKDIINVKTKFISEKPGVLIDKDKYNIPENTLYLEWYYNNTEVVKTVTSYLEKVGYFIVKE